MDAAKLKTLVLDLDGCLAGRKQYIDRTGEKMLKMFCSFDIRAIREFLAMGVRVIVWSADDWPGGKIWVERNGCEFVYARDKAAKALELGLDRNTTLVVGDDVWDVAAMKWARWSAAPHDAHASVWSVPGVIDLQYTNGGDGVVSALLDHLFSEGLS